MKKIIFAFITTVCCSFTVSNQTLTDTERTFAVKHLTDTKLYLQNAVQGLSNAQLKFKPSPERWSIQECLEHIASSEALMFNAVNTALAKGANPEKRSEVKITDEQLITRITDRSGKAQAPEILKPTGKYSTSKDALDAFNKQREETMQFIQTTNDDLRNHLFPHPAVGMIDSYQWLLMAGAHQKRHTLQIEEIKADKNFPK